MLRKPNQFAPFFPNREFGDPIVISLSKTGENLPIPATLDSIQSPPKMFSPWSERKLHPECKPFLEDQTGALRCATSSSFLRVQV